VTAFDMASSGGCFIIADSGGYIPFGLLDVSTCVILTTTSSYVHQWADREEVQINQFSMPTLLPTKLYTPSNKPYDDSM